jgi:hypothetical protein
MPDPNTGNASSNDACHGARSFFMVRPSSSSRRSGGISLAGKLIQVTLALYLIPALLIVLLVGGIGMLVLAVVDSLLREVRRSIS